MIVYISGPISLGGTASLEEIASNLLVFERAEESLVAKGRNVLNPIRLPKMDSWEAYMRKALVMVAQADVICMLPRWELSRGARLELFVAGELGLSVAMYTDRVSPS